MAKIKIIRYETDYDVVPQAIFWRALEYFTMVTRVGEDGLDAFKGASFIIGNDIQFDLRTYAGHPQFTVTLYLPKSKDGDIDQEEISRVINIIVRDMFIPKHAVAWQRGQNFEYGELKRPKADRLNEPEARILALKIAAACPNHQATTNFIKREVPKYTELSELDLLPSPSRLREAPREAMWQQIVRNVISHEESPRGPFAKGYATRVGEGIRVTEKGLDYLNSMGFLDSAAALAV